MSETKSAKLVRFMSLYRLPILSGFLIGTSYIPFPPWALFFCLVPLFVFWTRVARAPKQAFIGGWVTQFILNILGFPWIAYTAVEFGHFPWWGGALTLLGFAAIAHLHYAVSGWIALHLRKRFHLNDGFFIMTAATLFALCDHRFPMIFPWHLGYPWLWAGLPGAQFADVIGFEGLNIATIFINALVAWGIVTWLDGKRAERSAQQRIKKPLTLIAYACSLVIALNVAGLGRAEKWKNGDAELRVLAVQGNIGNFDKLMAEKGRGFRIPIISKYLDLSRKGLEAHPDAHVMIWPETAFPDLLDRPYENDTNALSLREFTRTTKKALLTGSYSYDSKTRDTFNGFFFLDGNGQLPLPPYRKSILLVFGETFPFSDYIPYMDKLFPDLGAFGRGQGPTILPVQISSNDSGQPNGSTQELRIGPQICYEGLYPWFSAQLARDGAQIFTNVTNDSWFGTNYEPYQHLYMTAARAIEFRRPLMHSTNTGITTAVLATGELLEQSPLHKEWSGLFRVPYMTNPPHTFYEKIAGHWGWILVFGLVLLLGFGRARKETDER